MKRHYILTPFGSVGDFHPFLWIARLLQERGHRVTVVGAHVFTGPAARAGVPYAPIGEPGFYERVIQDPKLWHPAHGTKITLGYAGQISETYLRTICSLSGESTSDVVLVGSAFAFGSRIAREKLRVPLVSVHLQPAMFLSVYETPVIRPNTEWFNRVPRWLKRLLFRVMPNPLDQSAGPAVRAACARAGVASPRSLMDDWMHSPDEVLALFPDWFATPQPDWPPHTRQAGFPLYDLGDVHALTPELERFLDDGPPPVVFTAGTAMMHGREFFATGVEACRRLGLRAIFATSHREQLPPSLPESVLPVDYAPFSRLLPRTAALVHHGGVGTLSQALAAGVPQLIMPMAHDQPDNANRLARLGVARLLYPARFNSDNVTVALKALLETPSVRAACAEYAGRVRAATPAEVAIETLESVAFRG